MLKLTRESENIKVDESLIRSLRYLTMTRSYIVFGVELLIRFMEKSHACHLQGGAKRILHYIKDTLACEIFYENNNDVKFVGYTNSCWTKKKNVSRYAFHLGIGAVSWSLKKQLVVALSIAEGEYIVTTSFATQAI
uniref:Retrovirus-related Pol polyprotein from transposon TNT 1-94 n=1 Tax=Cajanus cajan TaxID=3821 RepID=A0A151S6W1_CAJCA|nr:hypothetical protein KK1_027688 [Cajanus cajan]